MISVAIDAMGGDFGEKPIVAGLIQALKEKPFNAVLVGTRSLIEPQIPQNLRKFVSYEEANEVFPMEESATEALKYKQSTIYKSIELLREKKVQALVSAGHSGATMSLATLRLGRLQNVSRPAIATLKPNVSISRTEQSLWGVASLFVLSVIMSFMLLRAFQLVLVARVEKPSPFLLFIN